MCDAKQFLRNKKEFKRRKKKCSNPKTVLTIYEGNKKYGICESCWNKISKSDLSW